MQRNTSVSALTQGRFRIQMFNFGLLPISTGFAKPSAASRFKFQVAELVKNFGSEEDSLPSPLSSQKLTNDDSILAKSIALRQSMSRPIVKHWQFRQFAVCQQNEPKRPPVGWLLRRSRSPWAIASGLLAGPLLAPSFFCRAGKWPLACGRRDRNQQAVQCISLGFVG